MTRTPAQNGNPVWPIESIVDIAAYPLFDLEDKRTKSQVAGMRQAWRAQGSFSLDGFLRPEALAACVGEVGPLMARESFHHAQEHNIYFTKEDPPVEAGHGARRRFCRPRYASRICTCWLTAGGVTPRSRAAFTKLP